MCIRDSNNLVSVDLSVEEQPTGSISAGAGYGSTGGLITGSLSEKNYLEQVLLQT